MLWWHVSSLLTLSLRAGTAAPQMGVSCPGPGLAWVGGAGDRKECCHMIQGDTDRLPCVSRRGTRKRQAAVPSSPGT